MQTLVYRKKWKFKVQEIWEKLAVDSFIHAPNKS